MGSLRTLSFKWIENYCKQNPLNPFSYAVDTMLEEIGSRK